MQKVVLHPEVLKFFKYTGNMIQRYAGTFDDGSYDVDSMIWWPGFIIEQEGETFFCMTEKDLPHNWKQEYDSFKQRTEREETERTRTAHFSKGGHSTPGQASEGQEVHSEGTTEHGGEHPREVHAGVQPETGYTIPSPGNEGSNQDHAQRE